MICSRRALDAKRFESYFLANGFVITNSPKKADFILFMTCAYTKIKEDWALKIIQELSRYKAQLIIGGCLKGINEERLYRNFKGFAFIPPNNETIDELFPDFKIKFKDIPDSNIPYPIKKLRSLRSYFFILKTDFSFLKRLKIYMESNFFRRYCYLRIGWGCIDPHCTYCKIWRAVGKLRSKPIDICLAEFKRALENGYRNIVLDADNLGAYGLDINLTFLDLLSRLLEEKGDYKIEIRDFHPFWLIKYLDGLISFLRLGKIRLFQCAIQSGNNRILKLMKRRHNKVQIKEALQKIKDAYPKIKLHTHIMVGFPSETEAEFEETLDLIREIDFDVVSIFGYSKNPYILDPEIVNHEIPREIIEKRINKAAKFCRKHRIAYSCFG